MVIRNNLKRVHKAAEMPLFLCGIGNKGAMPRDNISWNKTAGKNADLESMPRANRGYGSYIRSPWLIPTKRSEEEATVGTG